MVKSRSRFIFIVWRVRAQILHFSCVAGFTSSINSWLNTRTILFYNSNLNIFAVLILEAANYRDAPIALRFFPKTQLMKFQNQFCHHRHYHLLRFGGRWKLVHNFSPALISKLHFFPFVYQFHSMKANDRLGWQLWSDKESRQLRFIGYRQLYSAHVKIACNYWFNDLLWNLFLLKIKRSPDLLSGSRTLENCSPQR